MLLVLTCGCDTPCCASVCVRMESGTRGSCVNDVRCEKKKNGTVRAFRAFRRSARSEPPHHTAPQIWGGFAVLQHPRCICVSAVFMLDLLQQLDELEYSKVVGHG